MPSKHYRKRDRAPPDEHPAVLRFIADDEPEEPGDTLVLKFGDITERDIAAAWAKYRDEIIERFAREKPGHRPRYWWFEQKEPRQRVGGKGEPSDDYLLRGAPTFFKGPGFSFADSPTYESEPHYLRRLDLLLPGELARLRAEDFQPVHVEISLPERSMFCPHCHEWLSVCGWRYHRQCPQCGGSYRGLAERIEMEDQ